MLVELFEGWRAETAIGTMTVTEDIVVTVIVTANTADASEMTTIECSSP